MFILSLLGLKFFHDLETEGIACEQTVFEFTDLHFFCYTFCLLQPARQMRASVRSWKQRGWSSVAWITWKRRSTCMSTHARSGRKSALIACWSNTSSGLAIITQPLNWPSIRTLRFVKFSPWCILFQTILLLYASRRILSYNFLWILSPCSEDIFDKRALSW